MTAAISSHDLLKTRLNALLRENLEAEAVIIQLNEAIKDAYDNLKAAGFEPHDAELALTFASREMLELLWYTDRKDPTTDD